MVVTSLLPVVVLLLIMPIGLLGIVLFIVGLVKKKPAMWGSGIAIGILGMLALAVGAGMLMYLGVRTASTQQVALARAQVAKSFLAAQSAPFKERTGLDLPPGTRVESSISGTDAGGTTQVIGLYLLVQPDFDEFLADNFTKAKWQDVAPTFQAGRALRPSCPATANSRPCRSTA